MMRANQPVLLLAVGVLFPACYLLCVHCEFLQKLNDGRSEKHSLKLENIADSAIPYVEALRLARNGIVNAAVIHAMRQEHIASEKSGSLYRRVETKLNLGAALLELANHVADIAAYSSIYRECQEVLTSGLDLYPDHPELEINLAAVRKNWQERMTDTGVKVGVPKQAESLLIPESQRGSITSYSEAVRMAHNGVVNGGVVDVMRREHASSELFDERSHRVEIKQNLGAALLNLADQLSEAAEFTALYREGEAIFLSALAINPANAEVQDSLAALRRNWNMRSNTDKRQNLMPTTPTGLVQESLSSVGADGVRIGAKASAASPSNPRETALSYSDALNLARTGKLNEAVVDAMRREHLEALKSYTNDGAQSGRHRDHLISLKINLGAVLLNFANTIDNRDVAEYSKLYEEGEQTLVSALAIDPDNTQADSNLRIIRQNILKRDGMRWCNPHMTVLGHVSCNIVVLQRLQREQLSGTLFSCDNRTDKGLIWLFESEELDVKEHHIRILEGTPSRRSLAYDARSLIWRDELCWISTASEGKKESEYMLFHCIARSQFLRQMDRSHDKQSILPLLNARGGIILADRFQSVEKNWSPFVVHDSLYITYSTQPHVVMSCDWERRQGLLQCSVAQNGFNQSAVVPAWGHNKELRGSSTSVRSPTNDSEFLSVGHLKRLPWKYTFFFYKFSGLQPPFRMLGFSRLFHISSAAPNSFDYVHGICTEANDLLISYGKNDNSSWYVKIPLQSVLELFQPDGPGEANLEPLVLTGTPIQFPSAFFGKDLASNLEGMQDFLRHDDAEIANRFRSLWRKLPVMSLEEYLAETRTFSRIVVEHNKKLEKIADRCAGAGAEGKEYQKCLDRSGWTSLAAQAEIAHFAFMSTLANENSNIRAMKRRQRSDDNDCVHSEEAPHQACHGTKRVQSPHSTMSYKDALALAMKGNVNSEVVAAMRLELAAAAKSGPLYRLLDVKNNLGVALMNVANSAANPADIDQECEDLFNSVLRLQPGNSMAESNLARVRKNRHGRRFQSAGAAPSDCRHPVLHPDCRQTR